MRLVGAGITWDGWDGDELVGAMVEVTISSVSCADAATRSSKRSARNRVTSSSNECIVVELVDSLSCM